MSNTKRINKRLANAEAKFQKEQLQAAMAAEQVSKAMAIVEEYRSELTDAQYNDVVAKFEAQKTEIEKFITKARDKYAKKLKELGDPSLDFGIEEEDLL
jgi:uncharacterized iron-regulated protein